jgi:DNA-binding NarL/FixJ family response regulator
VQTELFPLRPEGASIQTIKIAVADDHRLMLDAIRTALEGEPEFEIVGEAQSGEAVLSLVERFRPDLVLLDLRMPGMSGFGVLDELREHYPSVKIVVLSGVDEPRVIDDALRRGADAYVLKQVEPRDLAAAIRQATESTVFHRPLGASQDAAAPATGLSPKELTILRGVAAGSSNKELARALWVSEQTVKFHLTNIYRKLGVANRTEAARYAHAHRLADERDVDRNFQS